MASGPSSRGPQSRGAAEWPVSCEGEGWRQSGAGLQAVRRRGSPWQSGEGRRAVRQRGSPWRAGNGVQTNCRFSQTTSREVLQFALSSYNDDEEALGEHTVHGFLEAPPRLSLCWQRELQDTPSQGAYCSLTRGDTFT